MVMSDWSNPTWDNGFPTQKPANSLGKLGLSQKPGIFGL
jgi:hypothetical protein